MRSLTSAQLNLAQSEVGELDVTVRRQQHIVWLDVAVDDSVFVQIFQRHRDLCTVKSRRQLVKVSRHGQQ